MKISYLEFMTNEGKDIVKFLFKIKQTNFQNCFQIFLLDIGN